MLQDRMKQDTDWNMVSTSCNPLSLTMIDREDNSGTNGGPAPVCHGLRPGTYLLLVLTRNSIKPTVVRAIQHEGRCWFS